MKVVSKSYEDSLQNIQSKDMYKPVVWDPKINIFIIKLSKKDKLHLTPQKYKGPYETNMNS